MRSHFIKTVFRDYLNLTKAGIVLFALLTSSLAYFLSLNAFFQFSLEKFSLFILAFYFVSSGSFILNQAQEGSLDQKMNRTKKRPVPRKAVSFLQAYCLAFVFLIFGLGALFLIKTLTAILAFITVIFYNGFYTLWWKKYFKYGAVLGALPGAMPPVIGYSLGANSIFKSECVYLFLLLFFWQMPHFWSLAIHYREDYKKADIPVLPVLDGSHKTLYHIGLYLLAYLGLSLISPLFLTAGLMYIVFLVPLAFILLYQFHKYSYKPSRWLKFFLWVNVSIIIYFVVPVVDQWIFDYFTRWPMASAGF